ncbi:ATP-binding cassette domain-containing protein [Lysinibacillus sp. NPDC093210]|uniref:ATP-binding cassette domain-containing protein n=1 Tax=Lysinibacillus sp. NPDC093210 TaxID=3364133 RepID=UPI003821F0E8
MIPLSGGQIQRIALSRALLRNKNILLLDEITANLDNKTAEKIEHFLFSRRDLTIIMVTHRINDRLLKMVDGILQL